MLVSATLTAGNAIWYYAAILEEINRKKLKADGFHYVLQGILILLAALFFTLLALYYSAGSVSWENLLTAFIALAGTVFMLATTLLVKRLTEGRFVGAELEYKLKQVERMLLISQSFILPEDTGELIRRGLAILGDFLDLSKLIVSMIDYEKEEYRYSYGWTNQRHAGRPVDRGGCFPFVPGSDVYAAFITERLPYVVCGDAWDSEHFKFLREYGVTAYIIAPIYIYGRIWGTITADYCKGVREWSDNEINLMLMMASIVSELISRKNSESELIKAKNAAEVASRSKSEFLSRMSHEIRTPMNAIIGMTGIARNSADPAQKDYCLGKVDVAAKHLLGVINDVLDMSKIEADKFELSYVKFNLHKMLDKVNTIIEYRMTEKNIAFNVEMDERAPKNIEMDEQRLTQVLINILGNAVKFTPEGGRISLIIRATGRMNWGGKEFIEFSVKDSGIGITEEQKGRLFEAFEQADGSTSRKFGGTGLGLAISKRIVEMADGEIRVESELGAGSSFIFSIPMRRVRDAEISADGVPEDGTENVAGCFAGLTILVAEDIEVNREILQISLEETGVLIDFAKNGLEAVAKFKQGDGYSLILMDVHMPELDGYDATRAIRTFEEGREMKIPIIAMTADVFREDIEKCLSAGMNDHVGKPLDVAELIEKMRKYL
jgi:signal transduction histidine kinase/CheY-like chemotaxis protein